MTTTPLTKVGIHDIPPELYPIIISCLPLYATPSTVFALATTSRHIAAITIPLLYRTIILKSGSQAGTFLKNLIHDPTLGGPIRELHISAHYSPPPDCGPPAWSVVELLRDAISAGGLPHLRTLEVQLSGMRYSGLGRGYLQPEFWMLLERHCPDLRAVVLKGFLGMTKTWFDISCIGRLKGIETLSIAFHKFLMTSPPRIQELRACLSNFAGSLHTLELRPCNPRDAYLEPIFELDFPVLRSLTLVKDSDFYYFLSTSKVYSFLVRHPKLEYVDLASDTESGLPWFWFGQEPLRHGFLPNLQHLVAQSNDIKHFPKSVLNKLISLGINQQSHMSIDTIEATYPSGGLANLKSFMLKYRLYRLNEVDPKDVYTSLALTAHLAPNVEELAFLDEMMEMDRAIDGLTIFPRLQHLYFGYSKDTDGGLFNTIDEREAYLHSLAMKMGKAISTLISVTDVGTRNPPYPCALIMRGRGSSDGDVVVDMRKGYGMKIGHENEAFPSGRLDD